MVVKRDIAFDAKGTPSVSMLQSLFRATVEIAVVMATIHHVKNVLWNSGALGLQNEADNCLCACTSVVNCLMRILKVGSILF